MSKESGRGPRNQFILITTNSPSESDIPKARTSQKQPDLRNETVDRRIPKNFKEYNVKEKESSSSRLMCSICLNTRCQKCLKQTDNENHADSCPGIVNSPQNKCPRCYRLFEEPRVNSANSKDAKVKKETRTIATQDSRMHVSDNKVVQTPKTDMTNIDLLKLVLKLSDCPCKKTCKTNEDIEELIKEKYKENNDITISSDRHIQKDLHIDREQNMDEHQCIRRDNLIDRTRGIKFEELTKEMKPESEITSKTPNLVAINVCQISFGKSIVDFHDNESRCTVVNSKTMSEPIIDKRQFEGFLKTKSNSVPQMKIEELKNSLREKKKSKDAIEEVNRMFANVRKNSSLDVSDLELNRPITRNGPRILPFVKSPQQQKVEAMRKIAESKISQHFRHQKSEGEKCIYTLCCRHQHFDHEMCCQGDQKRKENVCCQHWSKRSGCDDGIADDFNSTHTSSTFS